MRTEKEIKKQINELEKFIKEFNECLLTSNNKDKKEIKSLIIVYRCEISALKWVLNNSNNLPF